jgi:hypothetical protein
MKKLAIIFVSFIILTISCERDSVNIKTIKESTPKELSKLQILVDSLGISEKYNLSTIVHNPENKFEVVGILHNYGCDFILEKMKNINFEKNFDIKSNAYIKSGYEFAQTMNIEIPNGLLEAIPFDRMNSKGGFIDDENLQMLVDSGLFTGNLKNLFIKLKDNISNCSNLKEVQNSVVLLENEFLSDESLSELERQNILCACAVFRYSSAYWASKGINISDKGLFKWLLLGFSDLVGFGLGTSVGGPAAGVIAAADVSIACYGIIENDVVY